MNHAYIVGTFDVAELAFLLFFGFFHRRWWLYLNKERPPRRGSVLEDEQEPARFPRLAACLMATRKSCKLRNGRGTYVPERCSARDDINVAGVQGFRSAGAPWVPTGDPMKDGMGPAAWANRSKYPDLTFDGRPRIVPIAQSHELIIAPNDPQLIGWPVMAADKEDGRHGERYLGRSGRTPDPLSRSREATTGKKVLAPMMVATVHGNGLLDALLPIIEDKPKFCRDRRDHRCPVRGCASP